MIKSSHTSKMWNNNRIVMKLCPSHNSKSVPQSQLNPTWQTVSPERADQSPSCISGLIRIYDRATLPIIFRLHCNATVKAGNSCSVSLDAKIVASLWPLNHLLTIVRHSVTKTWVIFFYFANLLGTGAGHRCSWWRPLNIWPKIRYLGAIWPKPIDF